MKVPLLKELDFIGSNEIGFLNVIEKDNLFNISPKRIYWITETPNSIERGNHAHKHLKQIIVAFSGVIEIILKDNKGTSFPFLLDNSMKVLFIPPGYWRTIKFSKGAILLCVASEEYEENDYIRNYDDFLNYNFNVD
jgi:hypothetical protein